MDPMLIFWLHIVSLSGSMRKRLSILIQLLFLTLAGAEVCQARAEKIWADSLLYGPVHTDLTEGWATAQGKRVYFPWRVSQQEEQVFFKSFSIEDSLLPASDGDSLFLWVEGALCEIEVVLNGQYWTVQKTRGGHLVTGIPVEVWREDRLELMLTIRTCEPLPFAPISELWLIPPIVLLTKDQLNTYQPEEPPVKEGSDSIAIVPAFFREYGWEFDGFEALRTLQPVLDLRLKTVYFPFPADRRMKKLCAYYGLRQVRELPDNGTIMWTASYPVSSGMSPIPDAWWIDESGNRTSNYGVWLSLDTLVQIPGEPSGREGIIFILLGILFLLLFLKMTLPGMFALQMVWLSPANWKMNVFGDLSASLPGPLWLWIISRWVLWGLVMTLMTLMLRDQGLWLLIRPENTPGIAWNWLSLQSSLPLLITRSMMLVVGIDLFRYILTFIGGVAFSIPQLTRAAVRLDMVATFPLVYLMGIPWAAAMLYPEYGSVGVWLGIVLTVIHLLRLGLSATTGLQQFFGFSIGAIFLYICTLNAIPYLLLW